MLAATPEPPYYAVIFTAFASKYQEGYAQMVQHMHELASTEAGFLGMESAGESFEITVSYWTDEASIQRWKSNTMHQKAQQLGKDRWYEAYHVRVAKVERAYGIEEKFSS